LPQQVERLRRQHDIAILAAFGLLDPNDLLRAVDVLDLQPDHFAGAQSAAIAQTEQHASPAAAGNGLRVSSGLAQVIDLGGKVQPPQRHTEQEPQPCHNAIAVADARAGVGQVQLKAADVLARRGVRGALQKGSACSC
jgi:hypothetical protein